MRTMRRIETVLPYDEEKIIRHLEKMARKGWLLSEINKFFWTYRRVEPSDLKFSTTWCSHGSEYNPEPTKEQQILWDYCKEAGWTMAAEFGQMQILYSEEENPMPVETDDVVKLGLIHQAMKKTYIPGILAGMLLVIVSGWRICSMFIARPFNWLLSDVNWIFLSALLFLGLHHLLNLSSYFLWYVRSERRVKRGELCVKKKTEGFVSGFCLVAGTALLLWEIFLLVGVREALTFILAAVLLAVLLEGLKALFRKLKLSKEVNQVLTVICFAILFGIFVFGMVKGIVTFDRMDSVEKNLHTAEELPLVIEDMRETEVDDYFYGLQEKESIFYHWVWGYQRRKEPTLLSDLGENELEYRIVEVKIPLGYDLCLASFLGEEVLQEASERWLKIDAESWGADTVYRNHYTSDENRVYLTEYVICRENRIVQLRFDWEPTEEELQVAAKKLVN